ncbi:MAG: 30S ribosome-binding factor RbfA [Bacteroidota bacterium]|nr:30S ribosome-binding factor RbfA [Bacteroidota bacterium]
MSIRTERVANVIRDVIGEMFLREIDTTGYGLLTVTDVIMTADLRIAKVYVSHYRSEKTDEAVQAFLADHVKAVRMKIGRSIRLKFTPEVRFYIDNTMNRAARIDELLTRIRHEEGNR